MTKKHVNSYCRVDVYITTVLNNDQSYNNVNLGLVDLFLEKIYDWFIV